MAIDKIQSESINLADNFAFTGTVTGAGESNAPYFQAYLSSNQTGVNDNTYTKIQFNTETHDSANAYDNSSNYRFTPQTAGKYFCYAQLRLTAHNGNSDAKETGLKFYFNGSGSSHMYRESLYNTGYQNSPSITLEAIITFNGSSDYLEAYGLVNTVGDGDNSSFLGNQCRFGAYLLSTT